VAILQRPVRFGVIGLGIGMSRCKFIKDTDGAVLTAVSSIVDERLRKAVDEFGCDYTKDYLELCDRDDVDVIMVMTPSGMHADMGIEAAKRGKHVITTKPIDVTVAKAEALIAACADAGVTLMTDLNFRYMEPYKKIRAAVEQGALGDLIFGEVRLKWWRTDEYFDGWRGTWAMDGGGSLMNQGIHQVDMLQWLMGPVKSVFAKMGIYGHKNCETEDMLQAVLTFENGALGSITTTTTFPEGKETRIEIHGTKGAAAAERQELPKWRFPQGEPDLSNLPTATNIIEEAVQVFTEGKPPLVPGEEAIKSVRLACAIYESAKIGREVPVN